MPGSCFDVAVRRLPRRGAVGSINLETRSCRERVVSVGRGAGDTVAVVERAQKLDNGQKCLAKRAVGPNMLWIAALVPSRYRAVHLTSRVAQGSVGEGSCTSGYKI